MHHRGVGHYLAAVAKDGVGVDVCERMYRDIFAKCSLGVYVC